MVRQLFMKQYFGYYHHSTGPRPDCIIEAWLRKPMEGVAKNDNYRDTVRTLPLCFRPRNSLGRSKGGWRSPSFSLNSNSNPLMLVIEVFLSLVVPGPDLFGYIAER